MIQFIRFDRKAKTCLAIPVCSEVMHDKLAIGRL